jgi:hypothetical protein
MRTFGIIASAAGFVLSLLAWIFLTGPAVALSLTPIGVATEVALPTAVLPAIGLAAGFALSLGIPFAKQAHGVAAPPTPAAAAVALSPGPPSLTEGAEAEGAGRVPSDLVAIALGTVLAGIVALLIVAVVQDRIEALPAALVLICGTLALLAGFYAFDGLARGDAVAIDSHWGGLGGGLGGWRLSPISTLLLLALALLGATIATGIERAPQPGNMSNESTSNTAGSSARPDASSSGPAASTQISAARSASDGNEAAASGATATNQAGTR